MDDDACLLPAADKMRHCQQQNGKARGVGSKRESDQPEVGKAQGGGITRGKSDAGKKDPETEPVDKTDVVLYD